MRPRTVPASARVSRFPQPKVPMATCSADRVLAPTAGALLAALACSCSSLGGRLDHEPWSQAGQGTHALGASTGWAVYEAQITLDDQSGSPVQGTGTSTADLPPIALGALSYSYFVTDGVSLGARFEARSFDPDPSAPLDSSIDPDEYDSYHYLLTARFWSEPLGESRRWRYFGGLDINYTAGIDFDATVIYAPGIIERVALAGDSLLSINPVFGGSYLLADRLSLDIGAFFELPLSTSDDDLTLNVPNGLGGSEPNSVAAQVEPKGLIVFLGLTYYL
jgi:hypothetical protein